MRLVDDNTLHFQASLAKFPRLSHPVTNSAYFSAWLLSLDFKCRLFWHLIWLLLYLKKKNLVKKKETQNKYHFFGHGWAKEGPSLILYQNSALRYFVRKTTSIAFNSNWYNLASMLLCNFFWKPFYTWSLTTEILLLTDNSFSFLLYLNQIASDMVFSY